MPRWRRGTAAAAVESEMDRFGIKKQVFGSFQQDTPLIAVLVPSQCG
jgi:hypothetical protein